MFQNSYVSRVARGLVVGVLAVFVGGACGESEPKPNPTEDPKPNVGAKPSVGTDRDAAQAPTCERTIVADVVALSQPLTYNRLGTAQSASQIFALARDVEVGVPAGNGAYTWTWLPATKEWQAFEACETSPPPTDPTCTTALGLVASTYRLAFPLSGPPTSTVRLRTDKRPRPLVLRANVGDCLEVNLANLLPAAPEPASGNVNTTTVGFHPVGLPLVDAITNDGQNVGANADSQVASGAAAQYEFYAPVESIHFVSSSTDDNDGMINAGLFGAIHIQPSTAEYYRSQVTHDDLALASKPGPTGDPLPVIDYQARYDGATTRPPWQRNVPVLNMLQSAGTNRYELVYGDLTAIITGANAGRFADDVQSPVFTENPASPDRRQPFRELTIIYHEPGALAQAFPIQQGAQGGGLKNVVSAGNDAFGINYGTGGIGAEVVANRLGVGPMADCNDCRYEEFFLSAWTVGDPAMNVDWPAALNFSPPQAGKPVTKATLAYYPDDPSNVYHSYISDHVKMQLHHGGATHHVHHLHAHQWLHSPNSPDGHYLDSQLFGPGSSFTLEMAYNGSGNRNQTVGDSIFHCHFYPHFAQGMWSMWRVHDVFEAGTELEAADPLPDPNGMTNPDALRRWPKLGARALPDGEIARGTPIPAIVPVPTIPMPPLPSPVYISEGQVYFGSPSDPTPDRWGTTVTQNPGYPFFIPGAAGHRAPHPPMDFATLTAGGTTTTLDGGLPRHLVTGGVDGPHFENLYDFSKFSRELDAVQLPEAGTPVEQVAMQAHAVAQNPSYTPEGKPGSFRYNGLPAVAGAPFADPCPTSGAPRRSYRAADIQRDVILNKDGWHNPQQRFPVLWEDVQPTFDGTRPPQPFFFRANSTECIEFWLTNLVPNYYEVDNFQVRTPTDILGQHIHLVKFDVTSSDGGGNGWNYEDGTFSYQEVQERIAEIMKAGGIVTAPGSTTRQPLAAVTPQYLCDAGVTDCERFRGAQTTVQRWWADPLVNDAGVDRTIRTVFTHDHFGPSTHQQAGLYAGLLVEPQGSTWVMAEVDATGNEVAMGTRADGGPTSWEAVIKTPTASDSYREFALEFQDLALAYSTGGLTEPLPYPAANERMTQTQANALDAKLNAIAPTNGSAIRKLVGGLVHCGTGGACKESSPPIAAPPAPQLLSSLIGKFNTPVWGTYSTNYRSEPLGMRLAANPTTTGGVPTTATCAAGDSACDTGSLFASIPRQDPAQNSQQVGEPGYPVALTSGVYGTDPFTPTLRAYAGERVQLRTLVGAHVQMHNLSLHGMGWLFEPSNDRSGYRDSQSMGISEHFEMQFVMPPATAQAAPASAGTPTSTCGQAPSASQAFTDYLYATSSSMAGLTQGNWGLVRSYAPGTAQCLVAVPGTPSTVAPWACPAGAPVRTFEVTAEDQSLTYNGHASITNANALVYSGCDTTLGSEACTPAGSPLVLRAQAGECIQVTLTNAFAADGAAFAKASPLTQTLPLAVPGSVTFDGVSASPSKAAGLHPQLLAFDPAKGGGLNVGFNPAQTVAPGGSTTYTWYAGFIHPDGTGTPVEFGVVNLYAPDPLRQANIGLVGAMVIEPVGATWLPAQAGAMQATVTTADGGSFTDAVLITTETNLDNSVAPVPILANYGTEPLANRGNDGTTFYSNTANGGNDPVTPIYTVTAGTPVRLRVVHPWGLDQQVFELYGHLWQEEPYLPGSTVLGVNPTSEFQGFRAGWGATNRLDVLIEAGGPMGVPGDYLYRLRDVQIAAGEGVWGILRVQAP